jgi:hypothetical protein
MDLKSLKDTPPWDWPEDTGAEILAILRDDQSEQPDRLLAAGLAGDFTVINNELAEALLAIVSNGTETAELRSIAAISFGPALEHAYTMGFDDADDILLSEEAVARVQLTLHELFTDADSPADVRRKILEASVRAPQDWHQEAVGAAYASDDDGWRLTGVFCMRFVSGFDDRILEALDSDDPEVRYHAVCAAGNWEVDAAWSHIAALVVSEDTDKPLRLAAIEATATIRPQEAVEILGALADVDDEDIVEAVLEALAMAEGPSEEDFDEPDW